MGGGLMQLVAYGAQDIYLTGNPQITFFKVVYRRHTNFSMEAIEQTMNGTTSTSAVNQTATCTISRNGDLIHKVYVTTDDHPTTTTDSWDGSSLVKEVELEIGGQRIDRHYTEWNQVWEELSTDESKAVALKAMKGDIGNRRATAHSALSTGVKHVQIPLNFWFCRNVGLALPLIALQYHEVKLKFTWGVPAAGTYGCNVIVDYIYLDTDERRRFAQVSHEYLIEQIQTFDATKDTTNSVSANLNFNHPVKELIWTNEAGTEADDGTSTVQLKLNGHDRFSERKLEYFQLRQPYEYHSAVPRQNLPSAAQLTSGGLIKDSNSTALVLEQVVTASATGAGITATTVAANKMEPFLLAGGKNRFTYAHNDLVEVIASITNAAYATGCIEGTAGVCIVTSSAQDSLLRGLVGSAVQLTGTFFKNPDPGSTTTMTTTIQNVITGLNLDTGDGVDADSAASISATASLVFFDKQVVKMGTNGGALHADGATTISAIKVFNPDLRLVSQARTSKMVRKVNVYSFGLKPEEHQPSGTCNFSRIDSAKLEFKSLASGAGSTDTIKIYAVNYNVLRIMSGMGGLAYSN
jgi:hypothetical protein